MNRMLKRVWLPLLPIALILAAAVYLVVTGTSYERFVAEHGHGHAHTAPHGGTLIVLGMHTAHIELVLDAETGRLDLYALDDHAVNLYSLPAEPITLEVRLTAEDAWEEVTLLPSEEAEFRQSRERALQFTAVSPLLSGQERFHVRLPALEIAGRAYSGLTTTYPEGNE